MAVQSTGDQVQCGSDVSFADGVPLDKHASLVGPGQRDNQTARLSKDSPLQRGITSQVEDDLEEAGYVAQGCKESRGTKGDDGEGCQKWEKWEDADGVVLAMQTYPADEASTKQRMEG